VVAESDKIDAGDLTRVSAALQKQAARDLVQFWNVKVTVDAFPTLEDVPIGYWPMIIKDNIGFNAAGIHLDRNNQPFALVTASDQLDVWSLTCSHELIEMVLDPFGSRLVPGDSPKPDQGRVQFLLEACDPSEAAEFAYTVNGILVSDFYSIRFFDPIAASGVRYSFTGAIRQPREVLRGGYLSWVDPTTDIWWQEIWFSGNRPTFRSLGKLDARNGSFRNQIDRMTFRDTSQAVSGGISAARAAGVPFESEDKALTARASSLRQQIEAIIREVPERESGAETGEAAASAEATEGAVPIGIAGGRRTGGWRSGTKRSGRSNGPQTDELRSAPSVWTARH
jgi:hypothetical protein